MDAVTLTCDAMLTFDTNRLGKVTQRKFNACWRELECDCRDFIALSADAGEHLAKAMLIALDIDPERKQYEKGSHCPV